MSLCTDPGCTNDATKKGMCDMHYMRWYRSRKEQEKQEQEQWEAPPTPEQEQEFKQEQAEPPKAPEPAPEVKTNPSPALDLGGLGTVITGAIETAIKTALNGNANGIPENLQGLLDGINGRLETLETAKPRRVTVKVHDKPERDCGLQHEIFPDVLKLTASGHHVFLVGPAGSGKTTLAKNVADALERPFYFTGAILQKYELIGFVDANGNYQRTRFRDAYENGGVFLWDEVDASNPAALVAFNAALENGHADFPDGIIECHEDFVAIAAGNTYGKGADRVYVGRNPLDGSSLERFLVVDMPYDEKLELIIAAPETEEERDFVARVQAYREAAEHHKIRHIISPRASIKGVNLMRQGFPVRKIEEWAIWKGLESSQIQKIKARASEKMGGK